MTLLLLAGTGEARQIADALDAEGVPALASLAGATRAPEVLAVPTRHGGFGGAAGFRDCLMRHQISAVLDATHPFAHRISARTARICAELSLPYAQVLRPAWKPGAGDTWVMLDREEDLAPMVPADAVVFLATGRQTLSRFGGLAGRTVYCRQIDAPDGPFPFAGGTYLIGRPPFSVADETKLFHELGVNWLVVKNAGGAASRTKLEAARALGIQVAMIKRPPQPNGVKLETVAEAMSWVRGLA